MSKNWELSTWRWLNSVLLFQRGKCCTKMSKPTCIASKMWNISSALVSVGQSIPAEALLALDTAFQKRYHSIWEHPKQWKWSEAEETSSAGKTRHEGCWARDGIISLTKPVSLLRHKHKPGEEVTAAVLGWSRNWKSKHGVKLIAA